MSTEGPSDRLRRCVEGVLPGVDRWVERTVPLGEARVWTLLRDGETVGWAKRHRNRDKAAREQHAYRAWLPHVGGGTAELLGTCADVPAALITAHVQGERADQGRWTSAEVLEIYRALGDFLARLHAVPEPDTDPRPLPEALRRRCAGWVERAVGTVDDEPLAQLQEMFDAPMTTALRRVPCHRDLQLHNVIVDREGDALRVHVIDFGQARMDCWLQDLVKLFQLPTETGPAAFRALLDGYGRRLTRSEADVLVRLRALHGLATLVWSADKGDGWGERLGRQVLDDALETWNGPVVDDRQEGGQGGASSSELG